jgi:hypothetical protein
MWAAGPRNEQWMRDEAARRTIDMEGEEPPTAEDEQWVEAAMNVLPDNMREYYVPSTGARITLHNAKDLIFRFCSKLPSDRCASRRGFEAVQGVLVEKVQGGAPWVLSGSGSSGHLNA